MAVQGLGSELCSPPSPPPATYAVFICLSFPRNPRKQTPGSLFPVWGHMSGHLGFLFLLFLCFEHLLVLWVRPPRVSPASAEPEVSPLLGGFWISFSSPRRGGHVSGHRHQQPRPGVRQTLTRCVSLRSPSPSLGKSQSLSEPACS